MTGTLDKKVLMKCLGCGYTEEVEKSMLEKQDWLELEMAKIISYAHSV